MLSVLAKDKKRLAVLCCLAAVVVVETLLLSGDSWAMRNTCHYGLHQIVVAQGEGVNIHTIYGKFPALVSVERAGNACFVISALAILGMCGAFVWILKEFLNSPLPFPAHWSVPLLFLCETVMLIGHVVWYSTVKGSPDPKIDFWGTAVGICATLDAMDPDLSWGGDWLTALMFNLIFSTAALLLLALPMVMSPAKRFVPVNVRGGMGEGESQGIALMPTNYGTRNGGAQSNDGYTAL
ncbi:hypothetical protein Pelo_16879 [Pelomyxa schiedti]|nr:hypothetical protein Pelo_16879 [Pelomyxa schiedti]